MARRSYVSSTRSAPHVAAGRLHGGLCRFEHAAPLLRPRSIRDRFPGTCEGIFGSRRHVCASRRTGRCPAFRARHGVLAVPADVVARLTAIRDQQAKRKRDAAHGALSYLQRPGTVALHGRQWFRRRRTRSDRKLFGSRLQARRHNCGRHHGCLPRRLSAGIGLSEDFRPGIIGAVWFGVAIAGRLGKVIVAELAEPVARLGPAVFLRHAGVVLPDLDLHVKPPVEPGMSAAQLRVTCAGTRNPTRCRTGRPLHVSGGLGSDRGDAADCELAGPL